MHTPTVLYERFGLVLPKARDCGDHEWHYAGGIRDGCYHCEQTRPHDADDPRGTAH